MAGGSMRRTREQKRVDVQELAAQTREAPVSLDGEGITPESHPHLFWPAKQGLPRTWRRHYPPCNLCRRILTVHRVQAVVLLKTEKAEKGDGRVAHMLCRACGGQFTLEVAP